MKICIPQPVIHGTLALALGVCLVPTASALTIVGVGDSVAEGVQSADVQAATQRQTYQAIIARQAGSEFVLPLIRGNALSSIAGVNGRTRIDPEARGHNLGVSGATVASALFERADATTVEAIDSETDLVLFPRTGSQVEIAETIPADLIVAWLGNNDALRSITDFDNLDASQLTPVAEFRADYRLLVQRLSATGAKVVVGDIPDLTGLGFLFDASDLLRFTGSDHGLLPGDFTSLPAALLLRLGLADARLLQDPGWVLDAGEAARIQDRIDAFNAVIREEAGALGIPVAPIAETLSVIDAGPIQVLGIEFRRGFMGGLLSLDGVHPNSFAQHLLANTFIRTVNDAYDLDIPPVGLFRLLVALYLDPNIDKDGDLQVVGRRGGGLLETMARLLGVAGDPDDSEAGVSRAARLSRAEIEAIFRRTLR